MTALAADNTKFMLTKKWSDDGFYVDAPVAAATTIYKWGFVGLNATGYLAPYVAPVHTNGVGVTAVGTSLLGIAVEHVDAADVVSNGDRTARVLTEGYFTAYMASATVLYVGSPVWASDDNTLSVTAGEGFYIGQIVALDRANYVTVRLNPMGVWVGSRLSVISPEMDYDGTLNDTVLLVPECYNKNGMILETCNGYSTEVHACGGGAGSITIGHTRGTNTTMGCVLSSINALADSDLILGVGGCLLGGAAADGTAINASNAALVKATAGAAVTAKLTAVNVTSPTGKVKIAATFLAL